MKISPVIVIGLVVTILSLVLFISGPGFVQAISNNAYDAFLRQTCREPQSDVVVIVDINEQSLSREEYGQWPWPRHLVAKLNDRILELGASVVAYDIVFAECDRTSPSAVENSINRHFDLNVTMSGIPEEVRDFDALFANSLRRGKTILGCYMRYSTNPGDVDMTVDQLFAPRYFAIGKGDITNHLLRADQITISIPKLTDASVSAYFNAFPDDDNIVRSNPLVWGYGERIYPALALEAIRLYKNVPQGNIRYDEQGILHVRLKDEIIPTDSAGRIVVNYRKVKKDIRTGFTSSFPSYSAADVIEGKLSPGVFKGKIVFVGTSAVGLRDVKATPVSAEFSGVEVHATIVDNILAGDILQIPLGMVAVQALAIIIVGVFLTLFIKKSRSWLSFLMSLAIILGLLKVSLVILEKYHLV
ncbi:MAG: CHASE2 domain-containing protein, partial [Lentisphaerae bacterium]|nr:CHASE2 domain-containing protein [Lentisphaerota bacterium]